MVHGDEGDDTINGGAATLPARPCSATRAPTRSPAAPRTTRSSATTAASTTCKPAGAAGFDIVLRRRPRRQRPPRPRDNVFLTPDVMLTRDMTIGAGDDDQRWARQRHRARRAGADSCARRRRRISSSATSARSALDGRIDVILTTDHNDGGSDTIEGGDGEDLLIGGSAGDTIDGDAGDDLIFGDQVSCRSGSATSRTRGSGRWLERSSTPPAIRPGFSSAVRPATTATAARSPSPTGPTTTILDLFHSDALAIAAVPPPAGADVRRRLHRGRRRRRPDLRPARQRHDPGRRLDRGRPRAADTRRPAAPTIRSGRSRSSARSSARTDGDDYIEGGGGNDVIFGNQGQDDIIGGSSDLFSLTTPASRPTAQTSSSADPARASPATTPAIRPTTAMRTTPT